ncbi:MAG: hypothetical protein A2754_02895 [Candidatus Magasanikbacteria bacterium RIFCSPHIGHO2_01_FULL_47_8]|uniref:Glycosyl transferase family 1 domain-containing protein n=1 Tax=Candidatus Magasanikbacteria bacterium RIFCSPHIGHO2_01_FULL_47_8 TaxID=1798673 RepID=A0A1F6MD72_9BACT|nr:MAG: hypothetical protein A2754_02895 [Candidatus Magasanikbacteria bacterium RIFCSPHIGHO2_01_FULL_47_8]
MRIILITSKLNFISAGGSVLDLHLKAKSLHELGHTVTVVTAFSPANKINQPLPYIVKEADLTASGWIPQQRGLYLLLKKYESEADAFYIDGNTFLYGGGFYRWLGGKVPVVAFFNIKLSCWSDTQNNDKKKQTSLAKLKRKIRFLIEKYIGVPIANHLDAFIFTTPMVERLYLNFGFKKEKSHVIPDFINTEDIVKKCNITHQTIAEHQAAASPVTLFCSGRMIPEKGFDLVIKAFAAVKTKENFRVIMSGGGPDRDRLMALAKELNSDSFISFPGWVKKEELEQFFRQAHIFILPKWWIEYTSVLLIEAMAYGLPCIVPKGGGLEWLTQKGALTFSEDSVEELTRQIETLGANAELRRELALNSFSKSKELDYRKLGRELESIMRQDFSL